MANQNGIFIVLKAWLPVEGSISEQIAKLQMVEAAHASGDYAELLKAATVEDIKTEQKTRRVEDRPATLADLAAATGADQPNSILDEIPMVPVEDAINPPTVAEQTEGEGEGDEAVPQFLKNKRKAAATDEAA